MTVLVKRKNKSFSSTSFWNFSASKKGRVCHVSASLGAPFSVLQATEPVTSKSVTPCHGNARPMNTFPAKRHYQPLERIKLHCLVTEAQVHWQLWIITLFGMAKSKIHNLLIARLMHYHITRFIDDLSQGGYVLAGVCVCVFLFICWPATSRKN